MTSGARSRASLVLAAVVVFTVLGLHAPIPSGAAGSTSDAQGTIYRLYRAYFLRDPDPGGFEYWARAYEQGQPLTAISENFTRSTEFRSRYGSVNDRGFVDLVYRNVMGRTPDQGGYDYWVGQMARGMPRGHVMIHFSDSAEFRAKVGDAPTPPPPSGFDADDLANERDLLAYIHEARAREGAPRIPESACLTDLGRRIVTGMRNGSPYMSDTEFNRQVQACGLTHGIYSAVSDIEFPGCRAYWEYQRDMQGGTEEYFAQGFRGLGVGAVIEPLGEHSTQIHCVWIGAA